MKMLMFVPVAPVVSALLLRTRINRFVAELVAQYQKLSVLVELIGGRGRATEKRAGKSRGGARGAGRPPGV